VEQNERYRQAKNVTLIGGAVNALLGFIKLIGGIVYHSHALVADGIHSFSDLLTDVMVLFASKYGSQDADHSHPYGHQRIETAATLILALILILAGAGIVWDSVDEIIHHNHGTPKFWALPIALLSILANEALYHYTIRTGKRIHSDLIIANAWHHRSDAASSVVVLLGLIGSLAGFIYLDGIAAIIVGFMIIKMGLEYGWNSVKELVDSAIDSDTLASIEQIIQQVDGVQKVHQLRSRMMGRDIFVDVHILVLPFISVSEGHFIAQHVHHALLEKMERVKDVTVHVDPEDDEISCPSLHLPKRCNLPQLEKWRQNYPGLSSSILHYIDGTIILDLTGTLNVEQWAKLKKQIPDDLGKQQAISMIRLFNQYEEINLLNPSGENSMQNKKLPDL